MDVIFVIPAVICTLIGLAGAVLPALPGPPLSYIGMLILLFCNNPQISTAALIAGFVFAAIITIMDYIAPIWLTNKKGGSKYGIWGTTIGLFIGLFLGPLGIIIAPFAGAFIGELLAGTHREKAFKVAFMSFVAFMLSTGIKIIYCVVVLVFVLFKSWGILWRMYA